MNKVVRIGTAKTWGGRSYSVYCHIKWDGKKLSITGVEGPTHGGNALGGAGQIVMHEWNIENYAPGWNRALEKKFRQVWDRWHLNDTIAGSPAQREYLESIKDQYNRKDSHYEWACEELGKVGLQPDPNYIHNGKPYAYGSAWLYEEVPADVIDFLKSLPDTDRQPAWV